MVSIIINKILSSIPEVALCDVEKSIKWQGSYLQAFMTGKIAEI